MNMEQKINVLLVDDRPQNLIALEAVLTPLGVNIFKANSGKEALGCLLKEKVAVILLDVHMPEMDEFETAQRIRERPQSKYTPIIFVTGSDINGSLAAQGYSVGAVDYLSIPVIPEILKAKIEVFINLFKLTNQIKLQSEHLQAVNKELEKEIGERKRIEEDLLKLQEELEQRVEERTSDLSKINQLLQSETIKYKQAEEAIHKLNTELEQRVRERTQELEEKNTELERMNRLFVGRELRMVELKERIRELEGR